MLNVDDLARERYDTVVIAALHYAALHYAAHARGEWGASPRAVTDWELRRAFELA